MSIFLQYVVKNNEYGWSMVDNLPTHGFLWKKAEDFTTEKINEGVKKDKRGYLLGVDVEYQRSCMKILISCHF